MSAFDFICHAAMTDVGRRRKNNEDSFGSFPEIGVWLVADGMGGGDDGEVASAAVVRAVDGFAKAHVFPADGAYAATALASGIADALDAASGWIFNRTCDKALSSCGSTVVGVSVDRTSPGKAIAFHAGDSRLYRLRGRHIRQITRDHSAAEEIGAKDETKVNPMFRSVITRAVGIKKNVDVEYTEFDLKAGDRVLICSDGLSRMLPDRQILAVSRHEADVQKAVSALIAAANDAGGHDNVTVVLLEIGVLPAPLKEVKLSKTPPMGESSNSNRGMTGETVAHTLVVPAKNLQRQAPAVQLPSESVSGTGDKSSTESVARERPLRRLCAVASGVVLTVLLVVLAIRETQGGRRRFQSQPALARMVSTNVAVSVAVAPPSDKVVSGNASSPVKVAPVVSVAEKSPPKVIPAVAVVVTPPAKVETIVSDVKQTVPSDDGVTDLVKVFGRKERINAFENAVKRALRKHAGVGEDTVIAFLDEMKKVRAKLPRFLNEARMGKGSAGPSADFIVDLQYALRAASSLRCDLAGKTVLASDWDAALAGDDKSVSVRKATARLIIELPEAFK